MELSATAGRRLLPGRAIRIPDAALAGGRQVPRRNVRRGSVPVSMAIINDDRERGIDTTATPGTAAATRSWTCRTICSRPQDGLRATLWSWSPIQTAMKVVRCDVCDASTTETGHGVLQAQWRDGERERMQLCRSCFGYAMATLKRAHWVNHMFDDDPDSGQED